MRSRGAPCAHGRHGWLLTNMDAVMAVAGDVLAAEPGSRARSRRSAGAQAADGCLLWQHAAGRRGGAPAAPGRREELQGLAQQLPAVGVRRRVRGQRELDARAVPALLPHLRRRAGARAPWPGRPHDATVHTVCCMRCRALRSLRGRGLAARVQAWGKTLNPTSLRRRRSRPRRRRPPRSCRPRKSAAARCCSARPASRPGKAIKPCEAGSVQAGMSESAWLAALCQLSFTGSCTWTSCAAYVHIPAWQALGARGPGQR